MMWAVAQPASASQAGTNTSRGYCREW